jgi:hypothetical protein
MLLTGWNMKDALAVAREEGTEDGIEIGREESMEKILSLIKQGYSLADIENMIKAQLGG